ncbi:hypothetical protein P885DRAFT_69192 [Corynascus similis CBS 632.67]
MHFEGDADDGSLPPPKYRQCGDHCHDTSSSILERYLERQGKQASAVWNLHDLPCGDLICRGCLQVKVLSIKLSIDANHERIWHARTVMEDIDRCFRQNPRMTQSQKRALIQGYGQMRRRNMKLYRFVSCLSPKPSRDLWIITQWVRDPPSHQRGLRWHCVICQGNSMDCERDLRSTQIRFPYLPGGQPALTPSS